MPPEPALMPLHPVDTRDRAPNGINLSELLGALSHALDLTEGQPIGHCVRATWIGMHVGRQMGLPENHL